MKAETKKTLFDPLINQNPITLQILGICSALAVTTSVKTALLMSVALTVVTAFSGASISAVRHHIPSSIRIIVQMTIIASLVIVVDQLLKAFAYDTSKQLSVFVGLIITNCIVMGRLEAFAMANKPWDSVMDGLGSGFGYAWVILTVAFFRELLGSGSIFNIQIYDASIMPTNGLFVDSIGAFMVLGILIWIQRTKSGYVEH